MTKSEVTSFSRLTLTTLLNIDGGEGGSMAIGLLLSYRSLSQDLKDTLN